MEKIKFLLAMCLICLGLSGLYFGVLSATNVSYNISGTITYKVEEKQIDNYTFEVITEKTDSSQGTARIASYTGSEAEIVVPTTVNLKSSFSKVAPITLNSWAEFMSFVTSSEASEYLCLYSTFKFSDGSESSVKTVNDLYSAIAGDNWMSEIQTDDDMANAFSAKGVLNIDYSSFTCESLDEYNATDDMTDTTLGLLFVFKLSYLLTSGYSFDITLRAEGEDGTWTEQTTNLSSESDLNDWENKYAPSEDSFDENAFPIEVSNVETPAFVGIEGTDYLVTEIGNSAFVNNTNLSSLTIDDDVIVAVGENAFPANTSLINTVDNFEYIKTTTNDYFYLLNVKDTTITSATIPATCKFVDSSAFLSCAGLNAITVEEGNTNLVSSGNCLINKSTKTLLVGCNTSEIPSDGTVTSIADNAFYGKTGLTSITVPDSVTTIGQNIFAGCTALAEVTIPFLSNTVAEESTLSYVFGGTPTALTTLTLTKCETLADNAFADCTMLASVVISDSVTTIGTHIFKNCTALAEITIPFLSQTVDSYSYITYVFGEIPTALETLTLTKCKNLGTQVFGGCTSLKTVTIPGSVRSIPDRAFLNCTGLTSVVLEEGVERIEDYSPFSGCTSLAKIELPDSLTYMNMTALYGVYNQDAFKDNLTTENGLLYISNGKDNKYFYCFGDKNWTSKNGTKCVINENCRLVRYIYDASSSTGSNIKSLVIPKSVVQICEVACPALESITVDPDNPYLEGTNCIVEKATKKLIATCNNTVVPNDIKIVGEYAFAYSSPEVVEFPDSVEQIEDDAFWFNDRITSITLPRNLGYIDGKFIDRCHNLESLSIDDGNTKYYSSGNCIIERESQRMVAGCKTSVIPDTVKIIGVKEERNGAVESTIFGCGSTPTSIIIPNSVTRIETHAFYNCDLLTTITMGNGVTYIGSSAFSDCDNLATVSLSESLTIIEEYAFSWCYALSEITIPASVTTIGYDAFKYCDYSSYQVAKDFTITFEDASNWYYGGSLVDFSVPADNISKFNSFTSGYVTKQ